MTAKRIADYVLSFWGNYDCADFVRRMISIGHCCPPMNVVSDVLNVLLFMIQFVLLVRITAELSVGARQNSSFTGSLFFSLFFISIVSVAST